MAGSGGGSFPESLTACGKTHAAFARRCIPAEPLRFAPFCVAFRSKYTGYSSLTRLVSRAPRPSRRSRGFHHRLLTACGKTHAAFDRRCIPAEPLRFAPFGVAFRSKYTRYSSLTRLVSRAPRPSRRSPGFHHRLLTACGKTHAAFDRRCIPAEPLRFAPFCVAFRSKYTRYSSLTRLVSRAPRPSRRSPGFHHRLLSGSPPPRVGSAGARRPGAPSGRVRCRCTRQVAHDRLKDAAVPVVVHLDHRVEPAARLERA